MHFLCNLRAEMGGSCFLEFVEQYLGKEMDDVSGLKGVSDALEESMIEEAKELVTKGKEEAKGETNAGSSTMQAIADDADRNAAVVCQAVAMYDFDGSNSEGRNISITAGAIIQVTEMDLESYPKTDGWWHGSLLPVSFNVHFFHFYFQFGTY